MPDSFQFFRLFFHPCGRYVWSFMRVFCQMAFAINYLCCSSAIYKCFLPLHFNQLNLAVRLFANKILPLLYISWVSNFLPKSKFEFLSGATLNRYILLLELLLESDRNSTRHLSDNSTFYHIVGGVLQAVIRK